VLVDHPDSRYLGGFQSAAGDPARLIAERRVVRMHLRLPTTTAIEEGASLTGAEDMRFWGLSLGATGQSSVIMTLTEVDLAADVDGYATLILNPGHSLPPNVSAANGYSVVEIAPADLMKLERFVLRNVLPSAGFACSTDNVPYSTFEHHENGGYMGEYAPFVDFPLVDQLRPYAVPYRQTNDCTQPD
jgi:hypothetical protein